MDEEYNWNIILRTSIPIAIIMAIVFYNNINIRWKYVYLILSLVITSFAVYFQNKKKENIFTAAALVLVISLVVHGLKNLGLF